MSEVYYEDFSEGEIFDCGEYTVTEAEILEFARKWDPQSFHTDPDVGEDSLFGGLVASGWQTVGICTRLVVETVYGDGGSLGSPAVEEVTWKNPVRPGDTLTASAEVRTRRPLESRPGVGLVKMRKSMRNQHGDPVLSMDVPVFFRRREGERESQVE